MRGLGGGGGGREEELLWRTASATSVHFPEKREDKDAPFQRTSKRRQGVLHHCNHKHLNNQYTHFMFMQLATFLKDSRFKVRRGLE